MTRAERAAEAARLRGEGLNGIQIAERMGLSRSYAYGLLSDPTGDDDRARKARYGQPCVEGCGRLTNGSDGRVGAPVRCKPCFNARRHAEARESHLAALRNFVVRYGGPPSATDWNPQQARAIGHPEKAERLYRDGCWPNVSTIQTAWGSWAAFLAEGGYPDARIRYPGDDPEVVAETIRLYVDEGLSASQVGRRLGVSSNAVIHRLQAAGVDRRPQGTERAPEHVRRRAAQLYAEGQSSPRVAAALGVSRFSVLNWAREAGVPIRSRGGRKRVAA